MKNSLNKFSTGLIAFLVLALGGCVARDVYPKYLKMKEEADWVGSQCSATSAGLQTTYKGSLASVRLKCLKPKESRIWLENFRASLTSRGYKKIRDASPPLEIYCLATTGIKMHFEQNEVLEFGFFYPDKECPTS
jgi:hypothetical protein